MVVCASKVRSEAQPCKIFAIDIFIYLRKIYTKNLSVECKVHMDL